MKKLEQEIEALRSSSGVVSAISSAATRSSVEDNIDMLSLSAHFDRRTESTGSSSGMSAETSMVRSSFLSYMLLNYLN